MSLSPGILFLLLHPHRYLARFLTSFLYLCPTLCPPLPFCLDVLAVPVPHFKINVRPVWMCFMWCAWMGCESCVFVRVAFMKIIVWVNMWVLNECKCIYLWLCCCVFIKNCTELHISVYNLNVHIVCVFVCLACVSVYVWMLCVFPFKFFRSISLFSFDFPLSTHIILAS